MKRCFTLFLRVSIKVGLVLKSLSLFHNESIEVLKDLFTKDDKVLVLGASGWFGQTAALMLRKLNVDFLAVGSRSRLIQTLGGPIEIRKFDKDLVQTFSPTVVVDFAFLTRELIEDLEKDSYFEGNRSLIQQGVWSLSLPSVRYGVVTSSGAVLSPSPDLMARYGSDFYADLKKESEDVYQKLSARLGKAICIIRPWSVSGSLFTKTRGFAFSDFCFQALTENQIVVKSSVPVFRRYVAVEDLIALGLISAHTGASEIIDSGGDLIELKDLADRIAAEIPGASVIHEVDYSKEAQRYHSDNSSWKALIKRFEYQDASLDYQISQVLRTLKLQRMS